MKTAVVEQTKANDLDFVNKVKAFQEENLPKLEGAKKLLTDTQTKFVTAAKLLGEDDGSLKKKTTSAFFHEINDFVKLVRKFKKDTLAQEKRDAKKK